jgi:hypothetical protein
MILLMAAGLIIATGCASPNYQVPIGTFQKSVNEATNTMGTYYHELNNFEREVYLSERLYNPKAEVFLQIKGIPTPLAGQFKEESIQARLDALTLLGIYGDRLAALAGSQAPERFAQGVQVLGDNLTKLGERFQQLPIKVDTTAFKYATPIATIVSVVGKMYYEARRNEAIRAALNEGAPKVNRVLDLLEVDLNDRIMLLQKTGTKEMLSYKITYYNENRNKSMEARRQMLNDIKLAAERYQLAKSSNPVGLVQAVREAHAKLVAYANSSKKPENLAQLVSALELFKNRVNVIANAVKQITKIREKAKL